eukprot:TRINITY_DN10509_c0_g1_i2.p2 TRINITY_DN10509_c0_g1~~TRINITY_DN10509_c0_g1_i2.p2  ORF type:complete len:147 (+),score=10.27 TRINITY_DN10509_c0_g1_i2:87-527(+)
MNNSQVSNSEGSSQANKKAKTIQIDTSKEEFPQARIKRIVKAEADDVKSLSLDASYVISKAAEAFLSELVTGSGQKMLDAKRRVLAYKDVAGLVNSNSRYKFLEDIVPQKISGNELFQILQQHGRVNPAQLEQMKASFAGNSQKPD